MNDDLLQIIERAEESAAREWGKLATIGSLREMQNEAVRSALIDHGWIAP